MNIPTDIIATIIAVILTALLAQLRNLGKQIDNAKDRIEKAERKMLIIMIMLKERGLKIPNSSDTDHFLRTTDLEGI